MPFFMTYPRCYLRRLPEGAQRNELSKGDAELLVLWDLYMNNKVSTTTWPFRKRVLEVAAHLLRGFPAWVEDQSLSPAVVGYNLDFLKDTLNYIQTGQRRIGVLQWLELVQEVQEVTTVHQGQHLDRASTSAIRSTTDTIQLWCSWPNGFEDMLLSLFLFFGSPRRVNVSGSETARGSSNTAGDN